jgi:catechol 2,3-dioxygenase-like lactoylglutathione lyase family enzyme
MPQFDTVLPILRMFDPAKTREFYLEFLGFNLDWEHRFAPDLPLYLQVSLGAIRLHLSEHHGDGSPGLKLMIEMTGLGDYHAILSAKAYRFARPALVQEPWNATTMTVYDPASNRLVFTEHQAPPQ